MRRVAILFCGVWACLALAACGDDAKPPEAAPSPAPPPAGAPPGGAPPGAPPAAAAGEVKKPGRPELTDEDFVESPANRDPFHSYLGEFAAPVRRVAKIQRKIILQRYALDELKLIAVVTGKTRPVAMFRDPTGLGVPVKRGDYISKNAGRVKEIYSDRVVIEIQEQSEDRQTMADRVIELHSKEEREASGDESSATQ
ncbi:MAG: pilus assembly protein PilP [Deltaproteobacteria bacterium]|nr:pilus assembly protein PilP [Deltaproteobacteria bacterium]